MKHTLEDMAARILRFTPAEALELAEAFAGLSKANGSNSELLTHRKTPEAALIDIGASALRELAAWKKVWAQAMRDELYKQEPAGTVTAEFDPIGRLIRNIERRAAAILAANA